MAIYSAQDVIKAFMASLDKTTLSGTDALDEAVRASSNFDSIQEVIDRMVDDCKNNDSDTFLQNYCGIVLDNDDTGAITGSDAGGSAVKNAEDIVPETGSTSTNFTGNSFTKNGLTFQLSNLFDNDSLLNHYTTINYNSLDRDQKYMWQGLYTWWADSALNLISESYGSNYSFDNPYANIKNIHTGFINDADDDGLAAVASWAFGNGIIDLDLTINNAYYSNFDTSNVNGIASNDDDLYLDRALAHEFTHAVMAANINNYNELPTVIVEGMAELTHGIDDIRNIEIEYLAKNADKLNDNLNLDDEYIDSFGYAAGYMLLRYFAKQVSDAAVGAVWSVDGTTATFANDSETLLTVTGLKSGSSADGIEFNDDKYIVLANSILDSTATVSLTNNTILNNGFKLADDVNAANVNTVWTVNNSTAFYQSVVSGDGFNVSDDGNSVSYVVEGDSETLVTIGGITNVNGLSVNEDTIAVAANAMNSTVEIDDSYKFAFTGNLVNKTIVGSDNNDSVYISGNTAFVNLGDGNDYANVTGNRVTIQGGAGDNTFINSGNNVNINTGNGTDTVINSGNNSTVNGNNLIIENSGENVVIISTGESKIDNEGANVNIEAGSGDDSIYNNAANVTINAGTGDDYITLDSNSSNVVIQYANNDGDDTIAGLTASDTFKITSGYYTSETVGDNVVINIGDNFVTVVDGAQIQINVDGMHTGENILDAGTSLEINGITFTALDNSTLTANTDATLTLTGRVNAVVTGTRTPLVTFDGNINFKCENVNGTIAVTVNDKTVTYAAGNITYSDANITVSSNTTLTASSAQDFTLGNSGNFNINGKTITAPVRNIEISVDDNGNILVNPSPNTVTVDGAQVSGNGTFTITGGTIYGTDGNDTIRNSVDNVTINAGTGNDVVDISNAANNVVNYNVGDGNDCIVGYDSNDTVNFGAVYSSIASGSDVIFAVNDEYVTIAGGNSTALNVVGTSATNVLASSIAEGLLQRGTAMAGNFVSTETTVTPSLAASTETWEIQSADGLKLSATHFTPNESTGRWVLLVHSYGQSQQAMYSYVDTYLQQGYNVLTPDMRAFGNSEGEYTTMGILESQDVALWTQEIVRNNSAALITLHGKNMGAAAVLMASARDDIVNVTAVIADGSYNTAYDYFYDNMQNALNVNPDPLMLFVDEVAKDIIGYSLVDASPINAVSATTVATLFVDNTDLYNACNAPVKQQISEYNADAALTVIDNATPTNIVFNGRSMYVTNAEGTRMSVNTNNYGTFANSRLTLREIGRALNVLISGNGSIVNFGGSTLRTSGSAVTTLRADTGYIKINGNTYRLEDPDVNIVMATDNHISSIANLNGTVSGNFSLGTTAINGTDRIYIQGDDDITISADTSTRINEIFGVNSGSTVVSAGTNATVHADGAGEFTIGNIKIDTAVDNAVFIADRRGSITTFNADDATITGSNANDTIYANGNNLSISAGTGNDYIALNSDTHYHVVDYNVGDGNDTVVGLTENDIVNIATGAFSSVLSGDDVIITVGDNRIVAKDAANIDFVIEGMEIGEFTLQAGESRTIGDVVIAAVDDSTLTANVDSTITINNGKVNATFTGMLNPEVYFDASNGQFSFLCEKFDINSDTAMSVTVNNLAINYLGGVITYYSDKISATGNVIISDDNGDITANFNVVDEIAIDIDNNTLKFTDNGNSSAILKISDTNVTNVSFNGTAAYNRNNNNFDITGGSIFKATVADRDISLTAADNAGGTLTFDNDNLALTFSPYSNDGDLILALGDRHAALNCKGTLTYSVGGNISLNSGTAITSTWDDGYKLTVAANNNVAGDIHFIDNGIVISPNDFGSLDTTLATPVYNITNIIFDAPVIYSNGTIILTDGSTIIGNINNSDVVISANDDSAVISFDVNGVVIDSGDGNVIATIANVTNTYTGSFRLTPNAPILFEGCVVTLNSDAEQSFTLADSGTYTINNFTIDTAATDIVVTADANSLSFNPNFNLVSVNGKQFSGDGIVTVNSDGTFNLNDGAAVVMVSADSYTIDNIPFRVSRNVAGYVTVSGSDNGFNIAHSVNGGILNQSLNISGDNDFAVNIVATGIGTVTGISSGATVNGGATFNNDDTVSNFNILTDGNSIYTFGDNTYTITGDDSVLFNADFVNNSATLKSVNDLNGTISGDFSADISINAADHIHITGDNSVDVVADNNSVSAVNNISNGATVISAGRHSSVNANGAGIFVFDTDSVSPVSVRARSTSSHFLIDNGILTLNSDNATISGSDNNNSIFNNGNNILIRTLNGNNSVSNFGNNVTIQTGNGNDSVFNFGVNSKIFSNDGNDIIFNHSDAVSIYSGDGDDTIISSANLDTIIPNNGNDFISLSPYSDANFIIFSYGNDSILGLSADDTLKINGNFSTLPSDNHIIANVNDDRLVIIDAVDSNIFIDGLMVGIFTIAAGESKIADDITFTAIRHSTLSANDDGSFQISDGAVYVVLTGTNDPEISFDAADGVIHFDCYNVDNVLDVVFNELNVKIFTGNADFFVDKIIAQCYNECKSNLGGVARCGSTNLHDSISRSGKLAMVILHKRMNPLQATLIVKSTALQKMQTLPVPKS